MEGVNLAFLIISTDNSRASAPFILNSRAIVTRPSKMDVAPCFA